MPWNDGNMTIDETPKPFSRSVTLEKYEIAMNQRCADCRQLFNKKGKCKCPRHVTTRRK